jgi:hypothetical protein
VCVCTGASCRIPAGATELEAEDWEAAAAAAADGDGGADAAGSSSSARVTIPLDATKTPMEVAEGCFKRARKLRRAADAVQPLLLAAQHEVEYLESVRGRARRVVVLCGAVWCGVVRVLCGGVRRGACVDVCRVGGTCKRCRQLGAGSRLWRPTCVRAPPSACAPHQVEVELAQMPPGGSELELPALREVQVSTHQHRVVCCAAVSCGLRTRACSVCRPETAFAAVHHTCAHRRRS